MNKKMKKKKMSNNLKYAIGVTAFIIFLVAVALIASTKKLKASEYPDLLDDVHTEIEFIDEYTIDQSYNVVTNDSGVITDQKIDIHIESYRNKNDYKYYLYGKETLLGKTKEFEIWFGKASDDVEYVFTKTNFDGKIETRKEIYDDEYPAYPMASMSLPTFLEQYLDSISSDNSGETSSVWLFLKTYTVRKKIETETEEGKYKIKIRENLLQSIEFEHDLNVQNIHETIKMSLDVEYTSNIVIPDPAEFETMRDDEMTDFTCIIRFFGDSCNWKNGQ